jgi:hypothetical protein
LAVLARWGAELLVIVPIGFLWARSRQRPAMKVRWSSVVQGLVMGAVLGVLLELGQLFIASGVSQGASVVSRALGWAVGAGLWDRLGHARAADARGWLRRHASWMALLHVVVVLALGGWLAGGWYAPQVAMSRLTSGEIRFVPFYYHYYTSEAVALQSLLSTALLYAPIGGLGWALGLSARTVVLWAGGLGLLTEGGKLFLQSARPDPTNVGIAMAAATLMLLLLRSLTAEEPQSGATIGQSRKASNGTSGLRVVGVLLAAALGTAWVVNFPVWRTGLAAALIVAAVLVWWRPVSLLAVVVFALPMLNLSIWSGWEYWDEFDTLLALCLVMATVSPRAAHGACLAADGVLKWLLLAVFASVVLSAVVGWAPWQPAALSQPGSPLSPWMSLRLLKGAVWALALYLVVRRQWAAGWPVIPSFSAGMVLGLLGVSLWVIWERWVFVGWWDASVPFRVAGPVVPMRMGGAYLDIFLVAALPFAWLGLVREGHPAWRGLCGAAVGGGLYAVAVTYTRTTYLAAGVVMFLALLLPYRGGRPWRRQLPALLLLLIPVALMLYHFGTGSFARSRLAVVQEDLQTRLAHMRSVVGVARAVGHNALWGRGLGRYPSDHYWLQAAAQRAGSATAVHAFVRQQGAGLLQLGPGQGLYVDQAMDLERVAGDRLKVGLLARSAVPGGRVLLVLCEKWLLSSAECTKKELIVPVVERGGTLLTSELPLNGLRVSSRPIRFSLANTGAVGVDIDRVSLQDGDGVEWLRNGDFEAGGEHWTHTSDDHLAWHVKNMALSVWFDMGWLGVVTLGALLLLALARSAVAAGRGQELAQGMFCALVGVLIASAFDAVVDEPRFFLLLLVLAWLAALPTQNPAIDSERRCV